MIHDPLVAFHPIIDDSLFIVEWITRGSSRVSSDLALSHKVPELIVYLFSCVFPDSSVLIIACTSYFNLSVQ
jgi:hypothetical protein